MLCARQTILQKQRFSLLFTASKDPIFSTELFLLTKPQTNSVHHSNHAMLMKRSIFFALALASSQLIGHLATAQVATNPVGFETRTIPASRLGALSLPLDRIQVFTGPVSAVSSNTITTNGANFGSLSTPAAPHVIRFLDGPSEGRQYRITANDPQTLTLDATVNAVVGNRYDVFPIHTLASFFGQTAASPGALPIIRNADPLLADNVLIRGTFGYNVYYNDGNNFLLSGGTGAQDDVPLIPDRGFLFQRRSGSGSIDLTVLGAVPITNLLTDLPAGRVTVFPHRLPVATTLDNLGIDEQAGWKKDIDPAVADNLLQRGTFGWNVYYHNGTNWLLSGGTADPQNNVAVGVGEALLAVRRSGINITVQQIKTY